MTTGHTGFLLGWKGRILRVHTWLAYHICMAYRGKGEHTHPNIENLGDF